MSIAAKKIVSIANELGPIDRAEIVDSLLQSFIPVHLNIENEWKKEVKSRLKAYNSGEIEAESLEELMERLNR